MCIVLAFCSCFITASAEGEGRQAYINGDGVRLRSEPTTKNPDGSDFSVSNVLATLVANSVVTVNATVTGEEINGNSTWYNVTYQDITGYVFGSYVSFPPSKDDYIYDENFENNLANFPESYRDSLRALHAKYPNWRFKAFNVGMTFDEAVNTQYNADDFTKTRKYYTLSAAYGGDEWRDMRAYDAASGTWVQPEQGWTYASRTAIEYYMDPRNFLTESEIFMFAQQSYDEQTQTEELLRKVISGHFLENGYDANYDGIKDDATEKDAYLKDIMNAAKESRVNPFVIAAMIIGEQSENSPLISGTYEYIQTDPTTNEIVVYEDYKGYYNFFNIGAYGPTKDDIYRRGLSFAQQQNPPWNSRSASITGGAKWYEDGYIGIGQDTYYFMNFNLVNKVYYHQYAGNVRDAYNKACKLDDAFVNNTEATVEFIIPVFDELPDVPQQNIPEPEPVIPKGDANFDGVIDVVDLAAVKMDILGIRKLEGNSFTAADVNNDGVVDVVDLAAVKMHILGLRIIG